MNLLKQFGLGILWALLSPVLLAAIALVGVFGLVNFFVQFVIMIVNFFRGKKLFPPLPEDEKAYAILKKAYADEDAAEEQAKNAIPEPTQQQVYIQQNFYQQPNPGFPPQPNPGFPNPGIQQAPNPYLQQPNPYYQQQNPYLQQPVNPALQDPLNNLQNNQQPPLDPLPAPKQEPNNDINKEEGK